MVVEFDSFIQRKTVNFNERTQHYCGPNSNEKLLIGSAVVYRN